MPLLKIQVLQFSLSLPVYHAGNSQDEPKRKQKDKNEGGREETHVSEPLTQSTDGEEGTLPPARGPVPKSHVRVSMGLTGQPPKVRGHREFLSLGAGLEDTQSLSFHPSCWGTTNPDPEASHNSKRLFSANKPQSSRSGSKARSHAGEVFPYSSASAFHSLATSPLQPEFKNKRAEMVTFFDCMEKEHADLSIWVKNWPTLRDSCGMKPTPLSTEAPPLSLEVYIPLMSLTASAQRNTENT